eukprot:3420-Heterococcus_DN1.PRE.5
MSQEQDFAALQQQLQLQLALNAELLRAKDESLASLSNQLTREKILSQERAAEAAKAQVALKSLNVELAEARKMRRRGMEAALEKDQFVDSVLHYLGPGHWAFVALINRNWRGRYLQYCKNLEAAVGAVEAGQAGSSSGSAWRRSSSTAPKLTAFKTYYTACMQSPSRLRMSNELGINRDTFSMHASSTLEPEAAAVEMLTLARLIGMPWSPALLCAAVDCDRADLVTWLLLYGCTADPDAVLSKGAAKLMHPDVQAALANTLAAAIKSRTVYGSHTVWRAAGAPAPDCAEKVTEHHDLLLHCTALCATILVGPVSTCIAADQRAAAQPLTTACCCPVCLVLSLADTLVEEYRTAMASAHMGFKQVPLVTGSSCSIAGAGLQLGRLLQRNTANLAVSTSSSTARARWLASHERKKMCVCVCVCVHCHNRKCSTARHLLKAARLSNGEIDTEETVFKKAHELLGSKCTCASGRAPGYDAGM